MLQSESTHRGKIRFVYEQDGQPEKALKVRLCLLFKTLSSVKQAYLVRVEYDKVDEYNVALCIRAGDQRDIIIREISLIFSAMFGGDQHVDILFLNTDQETEILKISKPFYNVVADN